MSNHVMNDRNELVLAVGAPGSVARALVEWPALIAKLRRAQAMRSLNPQTAARMFGTAKVVLIVERVTILQAAGLEEAVAKRLGGGSVCMRLVAPMKDVLAWLKGLRDEGSELVVERLKKKGYIDPARPRLIDPKRSNVFVDPTKEDKPC